MLGHGRQAAIQTAAHPANEPLNYALFAQRLPPKTAVAYDKLMETPRQWRQKRDATPRTLVQTNPICLHVQVVFRGGTTTSRQMGHPQDPVHQFQ
ncbi:hypothetical protein Q31a_06980 [Aureliella helgolandensis]|uniref:Uncharacterized protein n=1 Tax=Aureliella helgolandensis TaxID=2527968 RepID=A0A518G1F3_9BACT|nr:hypothetical protein Q31a_06980 [Aureliella helgolandensis]